MARLQLRVGAFCLLAATTTIGAAPQEAVVTAPLPDAYTRAVTFGDLDLRSPAGQETLDRRVGRAVRIVCGESLGPSPIFYAQTACYKASWADSRPQIDRAVDRAMQGGPATASATIIIVSAK